MDDQDRSILRRFFLGVALVIIAAVLVWLIFFRHPSKKNDTSQTKKTDSSQNSPQVSGSGTDQSGSPAPSGTPNSSSPPAQNSSAAAGGQPQLADTGPGDVARLFIGASTVAGFGHYLYRRRKNSSQRY